MRTDPQFWFVEPLHWRFSDNIRPQTQPLQPMERRPSHDYAGDEIEKMQFVGTSAIIPVKGELLKGATGSDKQFGYVGYEDIHEDLEEAAGKSKAIFLDISSPGGTAVGASQLAQHIAEVNAHVPVYSFTNSIQCSAAEYLSAACSGRFASSDAIVGSIGAMMATVSIEGMLKKFGVNAEVFKSGEFKGAGHPFKDLTPEQRDYLQGFINTLGDAFKGWMSKHRTGMSQSSMQGQIFTGRQGAENGLLDANFPSLKTVIRLYG